MNLYPLWRVLLRQHPSISWQVIGGRTRTGSADLAARQVTRSLGLDSGQPLAPHPPPHPYYKYYLVYFEVDCDVILLAIFLSVETRSGK